MGTRLQDENARILNALYEGMVSATIKLYENGVIGENTGHTHTDIMYVLINHLGFNWEDALYWLDWFDVE